MNPFKFGSVVEDEFFTDRVQELERVKQALDSENHLILISPRRFGKSSLVYKALSQLNRPSIEIDLMKVLSVEDLAAQLLKGVFRIRPVEKLKQFLSHFRILPTVSVNPVTDAIDVTFNPSVNAQVALEDVLDLVEKISSPEQRLIVVLDEFQEIVNIQKGLDRQLRAVMQRQKGLNYVFLGSQESMMTEIFEQKKSPFYHFGQLMYLHKIPFDDFCQYICQRLPDISRASKSEQDDLKNRIARDILSFTRCHPYYTQQLAAAVFNLMQYGDIDCEVVNKAIEVQLTEHDLDYERLWLSMNMTDRKILMALSRGDSKITGANLRTSTTYSALQRLVKKGYVVKTDSFEVEDPFFAKWIGKTWQNR